MRAYLHDLRHVVVGRTLIFVVVLIALGGALAYSSVQGQTSTFTVLSSGYYFYEGGAYHLDLWVFGVAGNAIGGVAVELGYPVTSNGTVEPNWTYTNATSDAAGRLQFILRMPDDGASLSTIVRYSAASASSLQISGALEGLSLGNVSAGSVAALDSVTVVTENLYSTTGRILVIWSGPNGSAPVGSQLEYCSSAFVAGVPPPSNCSGLSLHSMGALTGTRTLFDLPPGEPVTSTTLQLVNPQGVVVGSLSYSGSTIQGAPVQPDPTPFIQSPPGDQALSTFTQEVPLLLILMSFVMAYTAYAQPRLSGVLEPILVRPVTRQGILFERYLATTAILTIVSVACVLTFDLTAVQAFGQPLPTDYLAPLAVSLLAVGLAFAAVIFLASHLFSTQAGVFVLGMILLLTLGLLWGEISSIALTAAGGTPSAYDQIVFPLRVQAVSPTELPSFTLGILDGSGTMGGAGAMYTLASLSSTSLAAITALWIGLPLLGAAWLAKVRD